MSTPEKQGQLTIVGSGISSIGQLTLQTISHIEQADIVFYVLSDPATEAFVQTKNSNCVDLYTLYDDGKPRIDTYIQAAEMMLRHVRKGENVVGVFYGHPGVFVSPSHRAIAIAREEGHIANMLPGISAEDCLYADLNVDPSSAGCLTYEATDLLLSNRPLVASSHLILYQVGVVGISDFNFQGFENVNFHFLLDRLEDVYGPDHPVVHYIAAVLPLAKPIMEKHTIAELRDPHARENINAVSTFYLPPKAVLQHDRQCAARMGILKPGLDIKPVHYPPSRWLDAGTSAPKAYGEYENAVVAQLKSHVIPALYKRLNASTAMKDVMTKLALDPKVLAEYTSNPELFVNSISDLTPFERDALQEAHQNKIISSMKEGHEAICTQAPQLWITAYLVLVAEVGSGLRGDDGNTTGMVSCSA
jgi:precorrin-6B methylase 1